MGTVIPVPSRAGFMRALNDVDSPLRFRVVACVHPFLIPFAVSVVSTLILEMQALRAARPRVSLRPYARSITATASGHASAASPASSSSSAVIPLSNVEAQWEQLSADEQLAVHQQLEEIQKKDWKTLSLDEKKAGKL